MNNIHSQGMRMSLPPGTKLQGESETYIVKKFICMSTRSTTVLCEASDGHTYRLKFYSGQHCIDSDIQKKAKAVVTKGAMVPVDFGSYSGCPFSVYRDSDGTDTSKYPVSLDILIRKIVPQLAFVINQYHRSRILLRDICPEHIFFQAKKQQIEYCGFSNMVVLPDKVTVTKADGYGQHHSFVAPEVPKYGYSTCSDYYSMGVTILSLLLGKNPMQSMKWDEIQKCLAAGKIPGIDTDHLKNISYDLYSEEDKLIYLILGLMLPNPGERWGYGEIRCWCNNQYIPLVRKDGKIVYQYNEPFTVGDHKCWNYRQLTQTISAEKTAWNDITYSRLDSFAKRQNISVWKQISDTNKDGFSTAKGRIFRAIYGINPALDGFWWNGQKYTETADLIRDVAANKETTEVLSEILKNHGISFFLKMRKRISAVSETDISEMEQIEQCEISEPGKGVNRCIIKFTNNPRNRSFRIGGKEYRNMDHLLRDYADSGLKLKKISGDILKNKSFQAWLWANGMEASGQAAQKMAISHPEQSFYLLLKIAESAESSEDSKKMSRKLYLKYGEYAPVYWLSETIDSYKMVSISNRVLFDTLKNADLSFTEPLEKLSAKASRLFVDYQHFVSRTAKNLLEVESVDLEFCDFSFYPAKEDGFFCCKWENNLEVTPAFLRAIGESVPQKTLETWSENSVKEVQEKLNEIIRKLSVYNSIGTPSKLFYIGQCNKNIAAAVSFMLISLVLFILLVCYTLIGWIAFFVAMIFPMNMLFWYYRKKVRANSYFYSKDIYNNKVAAYQKIIDGLEKQADEVVNRIKNNSVREVLPFQSLFNDIADSAPIDDSSISKFQLFLGVVSAIGAFSMFFYMGGLFYIVVDSILMGYLLITGEIENCIKWTIITGILFIPLIIGPFAIGIIGSLFLEAVLVAGVLFVNSQM